MQTIPANKWQCTGSGDATKLWTLCQAQEDFLGHCKRYRVYWSRETWSFPLGALVHQEKYSPCAQTTRAYLRTRVLSLQLVQLRWQHMHGGFLWGFQGHEWVLVPLSFSGYRKHLFCPEKKTERKKHKHIFKYPGFNTTADVALQLCSQGKLSPRPGMLAKSAPCTRINLGSSIAFIYPEYVMCLFSPSFISAQRC